VEMQDVELRHPLGDPVEHDDVVGQRIVDAVEPECARHNGAQFRLGARIAAGEQGHLMALGHQLFRQPGYHPLGTAIEPRRHAFDQRRYLCNFHEPGPSSAAYSQRLGKASGSPHCCNCAKMGDICWVPAIDSSLATLSLKSLMAKDFIGY